MKKRITALGLVVLLAVSLFTGCSVGGDTATTAKNDYPVTVGNIRFTKSPEGVVVLSPSLADVVLAVKYEIKLTGRTAECTQDDLSVLPVVGSENGIDISAIEKLKPELVLTDHSLTEDQTKQLEQAGIKILVLQAAVTRAELETLYTNIGSVLGGGKTGFEKASLRAKGVLSTLDEIQRQIPKQTVATTACYLYDTSVKAATGDTFSGKLLTFSGAINVAEAATGGVIDKQSLLLANPTYIFCKPGVKEQLSADEKLSKLNAVQQGKVIEMDAALMDRQGMTLVDAVSFMAGTMYPALAGNYSSSSVSVAGISSSQTVSSAAPSGTYTTLQYGDSGDAVLKMQARLKELGHMYTDPSGTFDDMTEQGVKNFQYLTTVNTTHSLNVDGIANAETLTLLYAVDAVTGPDYAQ